MNAQTDANHFTPECARITLYIPVIFMQIPNGFELVLSTDIQDNANMQWAMISSQTHYKSQGLAVMMEYTVNVKKVACQACALQRGMKALLGEYLPETGCLLVLMRS